MYINMYTLIGYTFLVISTICTVYALKGLDMKELVFILPLSYIIVPLLAHNFFKEKLTKDQLLGIFVIFLGIVIFNADKVIN